MTITDFGDDRYCFICGENNPSGLQLSPEGKNGEGTIHWVPSREYQGYTGVLHGGIVSALLDEAMAYAAMSIVDRAATVEITINYRKPVSTDEPLTASAKVIEHRGRIIRASARILQGGLEKATATANFIAVPVPGEE